MYGRRLLFVTPDKKFFCILYLVTFPHGYTAARTMATKKVENNILGRARFDRRLSSHIGFLAS